MASKAAEGGRRRALCISFRRLQADESLAWLRYRVLVSRCPQVLLSVGSQTGLMRDVEATEPLLWFLSQQIAAEVPSSASLGLLWRHLTSSSSASKTLWPCAAKE